HETGGRDEYIDALYMGGSDRIHECDGYDRWRPLLRPHRPALREVARRNGPIRRMVRSRVNADAVAGLPRPMRIAVLRIDQRLRQWEQERRVAENVFRG